MPSPVKILLVEDDDSHLELMLRSFESSQMTFDLHICHNLSSCIEYLECNSPDMIICDWLLPDGKGIEILPKDRRENIQFPIVLMTSHGNEELAVEAMKAGALDYLVKSPATFASLPEFVRRGLREWQHILARRKAEMRLHQVLLQTVESLALMVEKRDPYTYGHQRKVSQLACAIAREMGMSEEQVEGVYFAAILHDIGKITVPAEFLNKPGALDPNEFAIIKSHPLTAYEMLKAIEFEYPVAQAILQHHEKWNGTGYPYGIKGEEILLEARILTVSDVVEAISSHRPYRAALGVDAALDELVQNSGTLYDKNVVDICLELFNDNRFSFE